MIVNRKEFYSGLSEDVKAKLSDCKTEAEMMGVLDAEKIELDPTLLDEVSGGSSISKCVMNTPVVALTANADPADPSNTETIKRGE